MVIISWMCVLINAPRRDVFFSVDRCTQDVLGGNSLAEGDDAYFLSNNGETCTVHECRVRCEVRQDFRGN